MAARTLPDADRDQLWSWVRRQLGNSQDRPALVVALGLCGLRSIEVRTLLTTHIEQHHLTVPTAKNGRPRTLKLPRQLSLPLMAWSGHCNAVWSHTCRTIPMFPTANGKRLDAKQVDRIIRGATNEVCSREYSFHKLRHTFAWTIYRETHDALLVQRLLGHASLANTQTYLDGLAADEYTLPVGWSVVTNETTLPLLQIWRPSLVEHPKQQLATNRSRFNHGVVHPRRAPAYRRAMPESGPSRQTTMAQASNPAPSALPCPPAVHQRQRGLFDDDDNWKRLKQMQKAAHIAIRESTGQVGR